MVQAINIHGAFLESWCRDVVGRVQGWSLAYYNYPVEWPCSTDMCGARRAHSS
jgi:hypothetical protein